MDNPVLRKKAHKVADYGKPFQALVDDMIETLIDAPGVGLAAPQVAVPQRLIVVRLPDDEESIEAYGDQAGVLYVVANPEIVKASKEKVEGVEACLSIPGYFGSVDRYQNVVVKGFDRNGKAIRIKAKDWLARVFQHEIDHLDGQLYIDIAKDVWKQTEEDEKESTADAKE
jgi:peptide deformylase